MTTTSSRTDHGLMARWLAERGLKPSNATRIGWEAIIRRKRVPILRQFESWEDHRDLWKRDGRAACYTSQPYDFDEIPDARERLAEIAAEHGLYIEIGQHPSWYYPGSTILIAIWPSKAEADFRLPTPAGRG